MMGEKFDWSCTVEIAYMPGNVVDERDIIKYMTDAGLYCGIGASRTLGFGRFEAVEVDAKGKPVKRGKSAMAAAAK